MNWRSRIKPLYGKASKVPPVLRSLIGVVLIALGIVGFLPVLGFWMVPLGVMFIALDVPPWRRRFEAWLDPEGGAPQA